MGKTLNLADGEEFVSGRSRETAAKLVALAAEAGLKGSVRTTYDGYIVPSAIFAAPAEEDAEADADVDADVDNDADKTGEEIVVDPAATGDETVVNLDKVEDKVEDKGEEVVENHVNEFDPLAATVPEVAEYLEGADDEERARVIAIEAASPKPRRGVLDLAATKEGK